MFGHRHWCGGRPAFAFEGHHPSEEGWQPWARDPRGPHGFGRSRGFHGPFFDGPPMGPWIWHMARRWGFGPGPFGPGMGPGGHGGPGPRMFGHGHLKFGLLDLLQERPKHGYEMMKELQDRSGGFYSPSAGAIYPTLQLLEDRGWVTSQTADGKKVYAITDAGRAALKEHIERRGPAPEPDAFGGPRRGFGHGPFGRHFHGGPFDRETRVELRDLRRETMEVAGLMRMAAMSSVGDPERMNRLRAIVQRARADLAAFVGEPTQRNAPPSTPPTSGEPGTTPYGSGPVESV